MIEIKTLKIKVNNVEKKIPDAIVLIRINQCKTDKAGEKNWRFW